MAKKTKRAPKVHENHARKPGKVARESGKYVDYEGDLAERPDISVMSIGSMLQFATDLGFPGDKDSLLLEMQKAGVARREAKKFGDETLRDFIDAELKRVAPAALVAASVDVDDCFGRPEIRNPHVASCKSCRDLNRCGKFIAKKADEKAKSLAAVNEEIDAEEQAQAVSEDDIKGYKRPTKGKKIKSSIGRDHRKLVYEANAEIKYKDNPWSVAGGEEDKDILGLGDAIWDAKPATMKEFQQAISMIYLGKKKDESQENTVNILSELVRLDAVEIESEES